METLGVIAPVADPSDWVSTMVIATKKNEEEIQICINPKDLNTAIKQPHYLMCTVEVVAAGQGNSILSSRFK